MARRTSEPTAVHVALVIVLVFGTMFLLTWILSPEFSTEEPEMSPEDSTATENVPPGSERETGSEDDEIDDDTEAPAADDTGPPDDAGPPDDVPPGQSDD